MKVQLFKDVTTEDILLDLEKLAEDYTGLYVEMDDPKQRKYVKEKAQTITDMLKALDRARIDKAKAFKSSVEAEALEIKNRLKKANEPFTLLIDEYKAERKKLLDAKKAKEEAIQAETDYQSDHEFGLLMNVKFDSEAGERAREKAEHEKAIADKAKDDLIAEQQAATKRDSEIKELEAAKIYADELKRASDKAHVAKVNNKIKSVYIAAGFSEELAVKAVKLLVSNQIPNTTFNY